MNRRRVLLLAAFAALLLPLTGCSGGSSSSDSLDSNRNALAIWSITGGSLSQVFEQMGYEVAVDRLWQLELFRRTARGELAEIFGEEFLEADMLTRVMAHSETELQIGIDSLDPDPRDMVESYVAGINRRIGEVIFDPTVLPAEFTRLEITPTNWTPTDVLAWAQTLLRAFDGEALFTGQIENAALLQELTDKFPVFGPLMFEDLRWIDDADALTVIPRGAAPPAAREPGVLPDPDRFPALSATARELRERRERIREKLASVGALVELGSYSWTVDGTRTVNGNPFVYSGPQIGFTTPSPLVEGSIRGGGLDVAGMAIPGVPGFLIGRTDRFAWAFQQGHAHTTDYYLDDPNDAEIDRTETILVKDSESVALDIYRTIHGPVIDPIPFDGGQDPVISWKYAHFNSELTAVEAILELALASGVEEFGAALFGVEASVHVTYGDHRGNIAYFLTGRDPIRPEGADRRFPLLGDGSQEWPSPLMLKPRPEARNPAQGFFSGWNTRASAEALDSPNNPRFQYGPFQRGHILDLVLQGGGPFRFEELRDLALRIAATDSIAQGGNSWLFVEPFFLPVINANPTPERVEVGQLLVDWDGQMVPGGPSGWRSGEIRADEWVLADAWIREVLRLTFEDELDTATMTWEDRDPTVLFNVLLHALDPFSAIQNQNDWFLDTNGRGIPETPEGIILLALDNVIAALGPRPFEVERGQILFVHPIFGELETAPFGNRSTFGQAASVGPAGPTRVETLFPLGQSGLITEREFDPELDDNFLSQHPFFVDFLHTPAN